MLDGVMVYGHGAGALRDAPRRLPGLRRGGPARPGRAHRAAHPLPRRHRLRPPGLTHARRQGPTPPGAGPSSSQVDQGSAAGSRGPRGDQPLGRGDDRLPASASCRGRGRALEVVGALGVLVQVDPRASASADSRSPIVLSTASAMSRETTKPYPDDRRPRPRPGRRAVSSRRRRTARRRRWAPRQSARKPTSRGADDAADEVLADDVERVVVAEAVLQRDRQRGTIAPAMAPTANRAPSGVTARHRQGVIATRPAMAPDIPPSVVPCPSRSFSTTQPGPGSPRRAR